MAKKTRQRRAVYDPTFDPSAVVVTAEEGQHISERKSIVASLVGPSKARQLLESLGVSSGSNSSNHSSTSSSKTENNETAKSSHDTSSEMTVTHSPTLSKSIKGMPTEIGFEDEMKQGGKAPSATVAETQVLPVAKQEDQHETKAPAESSFLGRMFSVTRSRSDDSATKNETVATDKPDKTDSAALPCIEVNETADAADAAATDATEPSATEPSTMVTTETETTTETAIDTAINHMEKLRLLEEQREAALQTATRLSVDLASARAALDDWQTQAEYWKEQYEQLLKQQQQQQHGLPGTTNSETSAHGESADPSDASKELASTPTSSTNTARRLNFWSSRRASSATAEVESTPSAVSDLAVDEIADNSLDNDLNDSQAFGDNVYLGLFSEEEGKEGSLTPRSLGDDERQARAVAGRLGQAEANDFDDDNSEHPPKPPQASFSPQSTMDFGLQDNENLPGRWSSLSQA
ncbi:hypothetical protein MPSEU_000023000 [Mayamaea pseudoterrestris]|nr:hypothetical protein MPSEU_000023000 [Mayamaea pseudoterrestris]